MHNRRGDLSGLSRNSLDTGNTSSFGMVHARREIYAVKDTVLDMRRAAILADPWVDGMGYDTQAKLDLDIGALSFGDTGESIGEIYITDITYEANWVISAH